MLYLTTGGNGAGKTLLTLKEVREKSLKENRPVVYNGRFELVADFGWKNASFDKWQDEPDGTIFIVDECHNDLPVKTASEKRPPHITMLAEHRRRGFDFYLITQHPLNIDAFVRRLIASPGWHRHLKRASGAALVSVLTWPAVNDKCEKNGAGASAATAMVAYPKEVYAWYKSTSLDTAKIKIPFQAKMLVACLLLVPLLGWYGYKTIASKYEAKPNTSGVISAPGQLLPKPLAPPEPNKVQTSGEYIASFVPRVDGLPFTAPRYDELNKVTQVPKPAACIASKSRCQCYTQQSTVMAMAASLCRQIAAGGFFDDTAPIPLPASIVAAAAPLVAPTVSPAVSLDALRDGSVLAAMRPKSPVVVAVK